MAEKKCHFNVLILASGLFLTYILLHIGSGGYDLPENQKMEIKKLVEEGVKNSMYFV